MARAAPAAQRSLNRPWLKKKLRPIFAPLRAIGVVRRDPQQKESRIGVVRIVRVVDRQPRRFRRMLREPRFTLHDPFHNLALGHTLTCQGILIGPLLKRFLHCHLPRAAVVGYGQGLVHNHLERGGP